jgi:hypothetical protein
MAALGPLSSTHRCSKNRTTDGKPGSTGSGWPGNRVENVAMKRLVTIYGRVLEIHAQKTGFHNNCDALCKKVKHQYVHEFKYGAKLLGLPDGSVLVLPSGESIRLSDGTMLVSDKEY